MKRATDGKKTARKAGKPSGRRESSGSKKRRATFRKQSITKAEALRRAIRYVAAALLADTQIRHGSEGDWSVYISDPKIAVDRKKVWVVHVPRFIKSLPTECIQLCASQVILVCQRTGRILYSGQISDEG